MWLKFIIAVSFSIQLVNCKPKSDSKAKSFVFENKDEKFSFFILSNKEDVKTYYAVSCRGEKRDFDKQIELFKSAVLLASDSSKLEAFFTADSKPCQPITARVQDSVLNEFELEEIKRSLKAKIKNYKETGDELTTKEILIHAILSVIFFANDQPTKEDFKRIQSSIIADINDKESSVSVSSKDEFDSLTKLIKDQICLAKAVLDTASLAACSQAQKPKLDVMK